MDAKSHGPIEGCLVLFTKPAIPGRVKTRLIGGHLSLGEGHRVHTLSAQEAAVLHQSFLSDLVEELISGSFELQVAWAVDVVSGQKTTTEWTQEITSTRIPSFPQTGQSLGDRLYWGLSQVATGRDAVGAVGSDHPDLKSATLEEGFRRLDEVDIVLGPADDGGYYFLGIRSAALDRELFNGVRWSTEHVLHDTLERCSLLGLQVSLLPQGFDVDTADDLERLIQRLTTRNGCPRTRSTLEALRRGDALRMEVAL